ncbi:MAG: hypothetical protein KDK05_31875, partial [Candidatus Competibacteraceae bacterium]|nr:hypothetical protein [Candidatus Competibacteraceae bacterium]
MQQDEFLSLQGAVERLAEMGRPYSIDSIRSLIRNGKLPCAVYWLTRFKWLYVDPSQAAHHEKKGWPVWAANRPEDLYPDEANPNPN